MQATLTDLRERPPGRDLCRGVTIAHRVLALLATAFLAACATTTPTASPGLDDTVWMLAELTGTELLPDVPVTVRFEGDRISGSDGCNHFSGTWSVSGETFRLGDDLVSTEMACAEPVMQQASAFTAALMAASGVRRTADTLQLVDANGSALAQFAGHAPALAGSSWQVVALNNGREAVESVPAGIELTITFGADGRATGSAGCNRFTAAYRADGDALAIARPALTRRHCSAPEGVMVVEAAFVAALETVATVQRAGRRLELRAADGALALALAGVQPDVERALRVPTTSRGTSEAELALTNQLQLPATFAGDLPCADCPGIRHHLDLWPDHVFHLRQTYLDSNAPHDELGRWLVEPATRTLVLSTHTQRGRRFEILTDGGLRQLDQEGRHIDSKLPYELARAVAFAPTDLQLALDGELTYMADAARFTECLTGREYPVAMEADFPALERAYGEHATAPGAPLRVRMEGALVQRSATDGPGTAATLVVRRYIDAPSGAPCSKAAPVPRSGVPPELPPRTL
jgi:heat shock protein HslJ/uncharacterized lipoprotein NlpE involved in copper resistance